MDAKSAKPEWAQSKREKANAARIAQGLKPRRRLWPWVLLVLIVLAVGAFFLLRPPPPPAEESAAPADPVMQLLTSEVTEIAPQVLRQTVRVTGSIAPGQQTEVAAQVGGRVLAVTVRPGDRVAEGDRLVQVETETLEIQLRQQRANAEATRAQLHSSQLQLARTEELAGDGLAPASTLEQARSATAALEANLAALEAQVRAAELALENATVIAPMSGIVSARSVQPGQTIGAGVSLLTIVDLSEVELRASAPVGASAMVAPGQPVTITVTGIDDRSFDGTVSRVNPVAVAGTRTLPVYIAMDNPDGLLRGGMFATGAITVLEQPDALAIAAAAVREDAEGFFVLKLEGDELLRQPVETGDAWDRGRLVEVVSGLAPGDVVVTAPLSQLQPGDRVELISTDEA